MRKYMSKRQRPCDFCRSRKAACRIESRPPCRLCALHNQPCTFVEAAPSRKKTGTEQSASNSQSPRDGQHSSIEQGRSPSVDQASPRSPLAFDASMQFLEDLDMGDASFDFMFQIPQSPTTQLPVTVSAPETGDATLDGSVNANPQLLGLTSDMDPFLLQHYRTNDHGMTQFKRLAIQPVQTSPFPAQFLFSQPSIFTKAKEEAGYADIPDEELRQELELLVPPEAGTRLISLYDKFVAPQCPVFSSQARPDPVSSPVHLLAAVYAVAFPFSMHDDKLCIELAYDAPPYAAFSRIVNASLPAELHSPSLSIVQTLTLMVLRPSSNPLASDASWRWTMLATLVSTSVNLGLHLDPSGWNIIPMQIAHRRRLSFLIYSMDKWLAAALGRPPQIAEDNWLVTRLSQDDALGSSLETSNWTKIMYYSALTGVLAEAVTKLYSLKAIHSLNMVDMAAPILDTLENTAILPNDSTTTLNTTHWLAYCYTKLLILRASARPFLRGNEPNDVEEFVLIKGKIQSCVADVVNHIQTLTTDDMNGFWPPWCQTAFSSFWFTSLYMLSSSSDIDEALNWITLLRNARKELRLKANSLNVLRLGLLRIDSIFWRGVENLIHLEPHILEAFKLSEAG